MTKAKYRYVNYGHFQTHVASAAYRLSRKRFFSQHFMQVCVNVLTVQRVNDTGILSILSDISVLYIVLKNDV